MPKPNRRSLNSKKSLKEDHTIQWRRIFGMSPPIYVDRNRALRILEESIARNKKAVKEADALVNVQFSSFTIREQATNLGKALAEKTRRMERLLRELEKE